MHCFQMNPTVSRDVNFAFEKKKEINLRGGGGGGGAGLMLIRRMCNLPFRDRMEGGLGSESNLKR